MRWPSSTVTPMARPQITMVTVCKIWLPVETAAPVQEAPVEEIEEKVMAAFAPQAEEAPEEPAAQETAAPAEEVMMAMRWG